MAEVVGVRFKRAGKVYYFDPAGIDLEVNNHVVVETARGQELGRVVIAPRQVLDSEINEPLKPVLRKAEEDDIQRVQEMENKEEEALIECGQLIEDLELPMKLLSAEFSLDGSRLTFYFSAEARVDFRKLVKELTGRLKARVELRQVGPRDEAKLVGGYGRCGRQLCCSNFLCEFSPVSIKMAKEQDVPLNPMKISGLCGRLLCCLGYENEQYRAMKQKMPRVKQVVSTPMGEASVIDYNTLKGTVRVKLETEGIVELPLSDVSVTGR